GVHHGDGCPTGSLFDESDKVSLWRDADAPQRARRLIQRAADRELERVLSFFAPHDGEALPVGRPVRLPNPLENLSGGAAGKRDAGELAAADKSRGQPPTEPESNLTARRHAPEVSARVAQ